MKNKKIIYTSLLLCSAFALASCGSTNPSDTSTSQNSTSHTTSTPTSTVTSTSTPTTATSYVKEMSVEMKVLYPEGDPVPNLELQLVDTEGNSVGEVVKTNSKGIAKVIVPRAEYYVSILNLSSDCAFNPYGVQINEDNKNVTLNLVYLNSFNAVEATKDAPFDITEGFYLSKNSQEVFFKSTFTESGTHILGSYDDSGKSTLKFYGTSLSNTPEEVTFGGEMATSKYEFQVAPSDVAAGNAYYFSIDSKTSSDLLFSLSSLHDGKKIGKNIGDICPTRTFTTFKKSGTKGKFNVSDNAGKKITIVNFWATWCTYCIQEMPDFADIQDEYSDDLDVLAIHLKSSYKEAEALSFISESSRANYNFIWAIGDNDDQYYKDLGGGDGIPYSVVVDKDGTILAIFAGATNYAALKKVIDNALTK